MKIININGMEIKETIINDDDDFFSPVYKKNKKESNIQQKNE